MDIFFCILNKNIMHAKVVPTVNDLFLKHNDYNCCKQYLVIGKASAAYLNTKLFLVLIPLCRMPLEHSEEYPVYNHQIALMNNLKISLSQCGANPQSSYLASTGCPFQHYAACPIDACNFAKE